MDIIHDFLNQFKTAFTRPSFRHFARLVLGFSQITGPKAVTEVNDSANTQQDLMLWFFSKIKAPNEPLLLCLDELCPNGYTKNFKPYANNMERLCWHADHHKRVKASVKTKG